MANLIKRDPHTEKRDAEPQYAARGKVYARGAARIVHQEMQSHPQQQGKQHLRRTVVFGKEAGRSSYHAAEKKPRGDQNQPFAH